MIIQVVNFNLEGITHEQYQGAATELAPSFNEVKGLKSKVWLSDKDNKGKGAIKYYLLHGVCQGICPWTLGKTTRYQTKSYEGIYSSTYLDFCPAPA